MIRKKDLGRMDYIAEGAVGRVHGLRTFRIRGCPPLAYKEIKPVGGPITREARKRLLDGIVTTVAFRAGLNQTDRDDLDEYTTWPIDVVEDGGEPCGLVMPLIPPDFFARTNPRQGTPKDIVLELSWLSAKESQVRTVGVDRSGFQDRLTRIALLAQLVYAIARLHQHGIVYGDLSLKNAALALNPVRVKLLDCDSAAPLSDLRRKQLHSPFFKPPELTSGTQLQDDRTDVYKLGLCVIRGLLQGQGVSQAKDPTHLAGVLDQGAIDVIGRAVGADRSRRPTAHELFECLERNLLAKASPPALRAAWLDREALIRGQDVQVTWESTGATEVTITGTNGLHVTLPDRGTPTASHTVTPPASGEIAVEVANAHGSARVVAGNVQLYELPSFQAALTGLPRPVVPGVPAVVLPPVMHTLPAVPLVSTAAHPPPRVRLPPLEPVANALSTVRSTATQMDRVVAATAVPHPFPTDNWSRLSASPGPDLAAAAAMTMTSVHEVIDEARRDLKDRAAAQLAATVRQGNTGP